MSGSAEPSPGARAQAIPARRSDLAAALLADFCPPAQRPEADQLVRMLAAILHFEYMDELERLHAAYFGLNPGEHAVALPPDALESAYKELAQVLEQVLRGANFIAVGPEELAQASRETGKIRYFVRNGVADFRDVRLFRRGAHQQQHVRRSWFGLRKEVLTLEIFDEVVLFAATKPQPDETRRRRRKPPKARPGSVVIKLFHDIARADLDALFPEVQVVMSNFDKLMLGLPALFAGIPLLIKLAPAFLVLYGLLRFYAGEASPSRDGIGEALIVASGIVALGGFLMHQWTKYERRALRYQKEVSDLLYFHNVTNNVGIFDHLIGVAEEQESKEALLAYFHLLHRPEPGGEPELDARIEQWLARRMGHAVDFEVADALGKLERFGLLHRAGESLSVLPLPAALVALDRTWDGLFHFRDAPAGEAAA